MFIDGHAEWVPASEMFFLHTWAGGRELYFWQQDLGEFAKFAGAGKLNKIE